MPRSLATRVTTAFSTRALFAAGLLLAVFCVVFGLAPSALQISGSKASAAGGAPQRTLSLAERVRYQRAVEEVYWRHTLWPKQNAGLKPRLEEVTPPEVTRARVEDALRKSDALARQWKRPVTAAQLQAEVARMARETRQPGVLRELWQALDNDPLVVAEVLARPALVERLARNYYSSDDSFHGALRAKVEAQLREHKTLDALRRQSAGGKFSQVEAVKVAGKSSRLAGSGDALAASASKGAALELTAAEWEAETARLRKMFGAESCETCGADASLPDGLSSLQEDENSFYVTSVVSASAGKRLRVARVEWAKTSFDAWWSGASAGFKADAATEGFDYKLAEINQPTADDTWTPTKALPEATGTAVWTGTEMIIWGGGKQNSGARYNPATDTWTPTSTTNVPSHRSAHTAVWTGTEMIVWGGCERHFDFCGTNDGGRYNPVSDTWARISITNAPSARSRHVAVWTGSKMIIWAGVHHEYNNQARPINSGGVYDLATDSWTTMNATNAPERGGSGFTVVWTGSEMIAWGGNTSVGGRYNPDTNTWTPTNPLNAPSPRTDHTAVWTGTEMIVWGGTNGAGSLNTGGRYNPANDSWTPTSTTNAPSPRYLHTAVWTGTEMIVWGGSNPLPTNTGGRYNPSTDSWTPTNTANAPPPKSGHVAVWTGELMIVWSVSDNKTGGRYNPANDSWTPTDNNDSPPPITFGVWSGAEMIVWSQAAGCLSGCPGSGKRYDPATYTWRPMSNTGAPGTPPADRPIAAVWTGTEMIVWGIDPGPSGAPGEGGRYNPQTDSWRPVTTVSAPVNRSFFTGVWTGSEMIVWGGQSNDGSLQNTGGRYNPVTDSWTPTNTSGAPQARYIHSAVWTGSEMIVWGGVSGTGHENTGGRYNPSLDSWTPTNTSGAPEARRFHTAVWTGAEMIVWGGRIGDYNDSDGLFNTGGRYNPSSDSWTPTATAGAPTPRFKHSAVWTGELMIVWGGIAKNAVGLFTGSTNTGGRYQPQTNAWTPTSTLRAPGRRHEHIAFWTGTGMLVWGGYAEDGSASHGGYYFAHGGAPGNTPPTVRITAPSDNATFEFGANVEITTETSDADGSVSVVQFYANDALIGSDSTAPFGYSWSGVQGGSYTLKAVATDDGGGVTTSAPVSFKVVVPPATANLSLGVVDSPDPVAVGNTLTYALTVNNGGQADASNVSVTATLPANAAFVSATDGCIRSGNTVTCALGQLNHSASRALSIVVTPNVAGTLTFGASVSSDTGDPDTSNNNAQAETDVHLRGTDVKTGDVLISEFRTHGSASVDAHLDDFVELYNNTDAAITVGPGDASGGWALVVREGAAGLPVVREGAAGLPVVRATIPKGTIIPARGHFLITGAAYTLGAQAASDLPLAGNILDDGGIVLFRTADPAKFNETVERLDAVGFSNTSDEMYREGAGLAPVSAVQAEQSFVRKLNTVGQPQDTGDNASDFQLISKTADSFGTLQALLGTPGPENTRSPIQRNATIKPSLVDPACPGFGVAASGCARVRLGGTVANGAFGTLTIRRRFTNKTGAIVNGLRFRITDMTTLGTPGTTALADLRAISSTDVEATVNNNPLIIKGTLLESAHPLGGGVNSTLILPLTGNSLAPNATIDVQFRLGVERNGAFRFFVNVEALTTIPPQEASAWDGSPTKQKPGK
jgi:uncharacterized repeat protein (TIGR01451 family)